MKWSGIAKAGSLGGFYYLWILVFQMMTMTLVTFLLGGRSTLQEISEAYDSNRIVFQAIGSIAFVWFLAFLGPVTGMFKEEIFPPHGFKSHFAPGFLSGATIAVGICASFLITGLYKSLGAFIQAEETSLALGGVVLKAVSIISLVYLEEFIFRRKILSFFRRSMPAWAAIIFTALLFSVAKGLQFDLGFRQLASLFLMALTLGIGSITHHDFIRGAGYVSGLLFVFHPTLSLPIFGDSDFHGIWMMTFGPAPEVNSELARIVTGGYGGPLSSLTLQVLFLFEFVRTAFKNRWILFS